MVPPRVPPTSGGGITGLVLITATMMQRIKPHLALAVILASVWALLAAVEFAFVGGWEGAVLQGFLVFAVGLPLFLALFLVVLNWAPARRTDWDAELAKLLEEMDR